MKVGDIVSIYDDKVKRQLWHIGRITEVLRGKDGNVRSAAVRTVNKNQKTVTLIRPIQKLIPLEIMATEVEGKLPEDYVKDRKLNIVADEPVIKQVLDEDVKEFINSRK